MIVDYLIIGQGISGTWLSYYLKKAGKSCIVIDKYDPASPSRVAAGIINPVTGRRHVKVWMADELLPFNLASYSHLGKELNTETILQKDIIDFFPSPQMRLSFTERAEEDGTYVSIGKDENIFRNHFSFDFGWGKVSPVYIVQLQNLLSAWRKKLLQENELLEEEFEPALLYLHNERISYKDIHAHTIIFCDGTSSMQNPYFKNLPFAPNKGEMLLAEIQGLPEANIYKKGLMLAPLGNQLWWIGSNYEWEFTDTFPSDSFRNSTEKILNSWLKMPFKILDHSASVRPATIERRPFVGLHPHQPAIAILNGMGTKGCSLAPWFANQLCEHLINGKPIEPEASVTRFSRVLSLT